MSHITCDDLCNLVRAGSKDSIINALKQISEKTDVPTFLAQTDTSPFRATPLHWAVAEGNVDIVKLLLRRRAPPNAVTSTGATPLHWACKRGFVQVVDILLRYKADPDVQNADGDIPRLVAQANGHHELVNMMTHFEGVRSGTIQLGSSANSASREPQSVSLLGASFGGNPNAPTPSYRSEVDTQTAMSTHTSPSVHRGVVSGGVVPHTSSYRSATVGVRPIFASATLMSTSDRAPSIANSHATHTIPAGTGGDKDNAMYARSRQVESENQRLTSRLGDVERKVTALNAELSQKDTALRRAEAELAHAKEESSLLKTHLTRVESSLSHAQVQLQQEQRNLSMERMHSTQLADQMREFDREVIDLRMVASNAEALRSELAETQQKLYAMERESGRLRDLEGQLEECDMRAREDAEEVSHLRAVIDTLQQQVAMSEEERSSIGVLHDELALMTEKLRAAEAVARDADAQTLQGRASQDRELLSLHEELDRVMKFAQDEKRRAEALELQADKVSMLTQQVEKLQVQLKDMDKLTFEVEQLRRQAMTGASEQKRVEEMEAQHRVLTNELVELRQQSRAWSVEQKALAQMRKEVGDLRAKIREDELEMKTLLKDRQRAEVAERALEDQRRTHTTDVERLTIELKAALVRIQELEHSLSESERLRREAEASLEMEKSRPTTGQAAVLEQRADDHRPSVVDTTAQQEELVALREANAALKAEAARLRSELSRRPTPSPSSATSRPPRSEEVEVLQERLHAMTLENSALERQLEDIKDQAASRHSPADVERLSALERELADVRTEAMVTETRLKDKLAHAEEKIKNTTARCRELDAVVTSLGTQRQSDAARIRDLENQLHHNGVIPTKTSRPNSSNSAGGARKSSATPRLPPMESPSSSHHANSNSFVAAPPPYEQTSRRLNPPSSASSSARAHPAALPPVHHPPQQYDSSDSSRPATAAGYPFPTRFVDDVDLTTLETSAGSREISASTNPRTFYIEQCAILGLKPNADFVNLLSEDAARVKSIDISNTYIGRKGVRPVVDLLLLCSNVNEINLDENRVDSDGATYLYAAAARHGSLHTVSMENNLCAKLGARAILKLTQENANIFTVRMDNSPLLMTSMVNKIKAQARENSEKEGGREKAK